MGKKQRNCRKFVKEMAKMERERIIPNGYKTRQQVDEIAMAVQEATRDIDAITRIHAEPQDIYRMIARITIQISAIKSANDNLRKYLQIKKGETE